MKGSKKCPHCGGMSMGGMALGGEGSAGEEAGESAKTESMETSGQPGIGSMMPEKEVPMPKKKMALMGKTLTPNKLAHSIIKGKPLGKY